MCMFDGGLIGLGGVIGHSGNTENILSLLAWKDLILE